MRCCARSLRAGNVTPTLSTCLITGGLKAGGLLALPVGCSAVWRSNKSEPMVPAVIVLTSDREDRGSLIMRSLLGLFLIAAGLGIGAYSYFPDAVEDRFGLVRLTRIMSPVSAADPVTVSSRTFSPSSPLFVHTFSDPADTSPQAGKSARNARPPVVIAGKNLVQPIQVTSSSSSITPGYSSPPAGTSNRSALVMDVQQELKRVGCYHGQLDGDWGPGSRRAMQAFIRKVNASLPVDEPDAVLFALLKSHAAATCAAGCEPGETENASGQCTPAMVSADTTAAPLDTAPVLDAAQPASRLATAMTGWAPRVRVGSDDFTLPNLVTVTEARAALPGRMAVGAPLPDKPTETNNDPVVKTAAIPSDDLAAVAAPAEIEAVRPAATPKKRYSSSAGKRARKQARQRQLMRQAFGDGF